MSAPTVFSVESIDVFYGTSQILFGVDIEVTKGQTMALLGRNGAGKTTTLKAIAGVAPPRQGRISVLGAEMQGRQPYVIARAGVGFVPEDRQIFPEHSVEDNLLIAAKKGPGGYLSGGEQQMLAIARTLMGNPVALLLDEPSEGLAPIVVQRIAKLLRYLRDTGATVLLAEQNMHFCLGIASEATVIDKGKIVYRDTIDGLKSNDEIRQRYLAI